MPGPEITRLVRKVDELTEALNAVKESLVKRVKALEARAGLEKDKAKDKKKRK
ncbi:MAG: hypothetical protein V3S83_12365 [Gemmatimonadota bacterium]